MGVVKTRRAKDRAQRPEDPSAENLRRWVAAAQRAEKELLNTFGKFNQSLRECEESFIQMGKYLAALAHHVEERSNPTCDVCGHPMRVDGIVLEWCNCDLCGQSSHLNCRPLHRQDCPHATPGDKKKGGW